MKRYDFTKQEPKWQKFWEKEGIFKFNPKKKGEIYSIDTDPPTLSGKMHIGHASSYTHEDIIARYQRMRGKNVFFPFGVDNNGLPTEKLVEKENKVKLFQLGRKKFINLCQKTIKKILPNFINDWKRIGMSCDFSKVYSTISPEVQKLSQTYFLELHEQGRIYKKESPTIWCPECQTAIAQAELEDKEQEGIFNDIQFQLEGGKKILISTTRPELLPSCVAVFINPKDKRYKDLIGKKAIVPLFNQKVEIIEDKAVDIQKGSGIVMCCTFGDTKDIDWYYKYKLPLKTSITQDGKMNELAKAYSGLSIQKAKEKILEELKKKEFLKEQKRITHTLNVHERCNTPIEIIPTSQWFIRYLDLKDKFLEQSSTLNWNPEYMKIRLDNWIKGLRMDWCISRQRYFGIPIPAWYCKKCGKYILPDKKDLPIDPLFSEPKKKCKCGNTKFIPEKDVLDTWATSSLTPQISLSLIKGKKIKEKMSPMSLRPQSHDIINFWLFYTLARSYLHFKKLPWRDICISGFGLDSEGEKMSKSKGNVIDPREVIQKYGADAVRYWSAQASLGDDIRYNEEELQQGKRMVTKIWNASQFSILHLKKYSPKRIHSQYLEDEDKWILTKLYKTKKEYIKRMNGYQYARAKETLDSFFWKDFCDNYLEIVKLRVYNPENKKNYQAAQFTLYSILFSIIQLISPIMPFISEEIYQNFFKKREKEKSIHLTQISEPNQKLYFPKASFDFESVIDAIAQIRKQKSEKHLSMKAEIDNIWVETKNKKVKKYFPLIQKLLSVKEIKVR